MIVAVDGGWTEWSLWNLPTITCGVDGLVSRSRSCDNPTPANGGQLCRGQYIEQKLVSVNIPCRKCEVTQSLRYSSINGICICGIRLVTSLLQQDYRCCCYCCCRLFDAVP